MKKRAIVLGSFVALTGAAGTALAGDSSLDEVVVRDNYASGTVAGARLSSDDRQEIYCYTQAGQDYVRGMCWARDKNGAYRACFAANDEQLETMRSIGPASRISFWQADDLYYCDLIAVTSGSRFLLVD